MSTSVFNSMESDARKFFEEAGIFPEKVSIRLLVEQEWTGELILQVQDSRAIAFATMQGKPVDLPVHENTVKWDTELLRAAVKKCVECLQHA